MWTALNKHYHQPYSGEEEAEPEERAAVIGPVTHAFPLNDGWHPLDLSPHKAKDVPRRLADLTIHEMTVILTNRITKGVRPNCEANWVWDQRKGIPRWPRPLPPKFKWPNIWKALGTPLSDPTEEKSFRRLLHRAIDAKNRHPGTDHTCRFRCGCQDESMLHMIQCRTSRKLWSKCFDFCTHALDMPRQAHHTEEAIVFNVDKSGELLNETVRAYLRHAVRWWYASMTKVYKEGKIFNINKVYLQTLEGIRDAGIRYGVQMRRLYTHRKYTDLTEVAPEEARIRFINIVSIDEAGTYTISPTLLNEIATARGALQQPTRT